MAMTHFNAVLLFATFASVVFAITQRSTPKAMLRYGIYCWLWFVLSVIVIAWVLHWIHP
ncbi:MULTISPECIES: hypothetical protein [Acidobacterium]|uniref:Uncharacterized protein n=1 Tax=Acidobacterium capsulatum (strain ATCC 51196 / DSM 11244 / BCRC 80197 / JCM 7670 / NBRC 15755 / NCIMB 13165 / 161) TaxID=240015 RepID=C1F2R2_ACIC5|nr:MULTISPECIES: hypothetical protein [Acidobacterium]ACO33546.1 conserved hypothetical protein [Acidobacterium capsulatum ATCC 51196]